MVQKYTPSGHALTLPIIFGVFMALTTVMVLLRIYVRKFLVKKLGLDDWLALLGWFVFMVEGVFAIVGSLHGVGEHVELIPAKDVPIALMWFWICELLYFASNMVIKASIALTLLRFVVEESHRTTIVAFTAVLLITSVAGAFVFAFQCIPAPYFWTRAKRATDGKCVEPGILVAAIYIYSAVNCIWDWTMAILPWLMVRNLQLARMTKLTIAMILGLGSIASIATLIRFPYVHFLADRDDLLYKSSKVAIWVVIETGLSLAASSMATLKPLVKAIQSKQSGKHVQAKVAETGSNPSSGSSLGTTKPTFVPRCSTYSCTITANGHSCSFD